MAYTLALTQWTKLEDCLKGKGIAYVFYPGRNDGFMYQQGNPDGPSKYHIHSIEASKKEDMNFSGLLAKSSNWRGGDEPDLAQLPLKDWMAACAGMDSSTLAVVSALAQCFQQLGAVFVPDAD